MKRKMMFFIMALAMLAVSIVAAGCGDTKVATTSASCGFIVNNSDTDKSVDKVIYPNQSASWSDDDDKKALYFPCNSRTYGINEGNKRNANGDPIGDRFTLAPGTTESGTDIKVALTGYWTLNQNTDVLRDYFYPLCEKYSCWSESRISNSANYADEGWNGMLGENMGEALDRTVRRVTAQFPDSIWQRGTQAEYDELGEKLSNQFAEDVRKATGYQEDLFCGSGNSGWPDPKKPGDGEFICTNVRFIVDDVVNEDRERQEQANDANGLKSQIEDNEKELRAAQAKYGPEASFWLGAKDYAASCGKNCPPIYVTDDVVESAR